MPAHAARRAAPPRHARRVSGPVRRPVPVAAPVRRGSTGVFERIRALPDHRAVDRMLRSRAWIWLIGLALLGIVAMQVSLLKLNTGISRAVTTMATLERQNAELEASIGRLSSGERIRGAALQDGMIVPEPGAVEFLTLRPGRDERLASRRMQPPSDEAIALQANGGVVPGSLIEPVDPALAATTTTTEPVAPVVTDPAAATVAVDPAATTSAP